jgi:hypothetical protein
VWTSIHNAFRATLGWRQSRFPHQIEQLRAHIWFGHRASEKFDNQFFYLEHQGQFGMSTWEPGEIVFLECDYAAVMHNRNSFSEDGLCI